MGSNGNVQPRGFRKPESYEAERRTRDMLGDFLTSRGLSIVSDKRERNGQTIVATTEDDGRLVMRVRLCWRRESGIQASDRVKDILGCATACQNQEWGLGGDSTGKD